MEQRKVWSRWAAVLGLVLAGLSRAIAAPAPALVTILEGEASVLR